MTWWQWLLAGWAAIILFVLVLGWRRAVVRERERQARVDKHGWWRWRWSQDGWVRQCKICKAVQYGGDDYDGGPDDGGRVVSD